MILFTAVGTGATALVARMVGGQDLKNANRVVQQALLLAFLFGLLLTILIQVFAGQAMLLIGAQGETVELGISYLRIAGSVFALSSIMFVGNACLRGAGDTRTPLFVMGVVNVLNIAVAWTLINGAFGLPRMGVAGSAMGALAGRLVGGLLVLGILLKGRSGLSLRSQPFRVDTTLIQRILRVGVPTGLEQLIIRSGMMLYARVVSSLGIVAYAAHQIAVNAESLSYMPGFGFAVAATTLVGQGLGAKDPERSEGDGMIAFYLGAALMTIMGICFILFPRSFISFFTNEEAVIAAGVRPLQLVGFAQPFLASSMIMSGALRGAGETRSPMLINGISIWTVRLPLSLLFTRALSLGLFGAWIAMVIDLAVRGTLMFARFRMGRWKTVEV